MSAWVLLGYLPTCVGAAEVLRAVGIYSYTLGADLASAGTSQVTRASINTLLP